MIMSDDEKSSSEPVDPVDPTAKAQELSRPAMPKRFYQAANAEETPDGFEIHLDGRPVRSPSGNSLVVPTGELAAALAAEWEAQDKVINAATMPLTRLVNSALDGVAPRLGEVVDDIVRYSGSDLLCYRADGPDGLVARQTAVWDPILDWASDRLGARFVLAEGIMYVAQPVAVQEALRSRLELLSALPLAATHAMTSLCGSALLAFGVLDGHLTDEEAWAAAHVDEDWNIDQWGEDLEAKQTRAGKWQDMRAAGTLIAAFRNL